MESVIIDAGTLTFSEEDLTATGLLVPFGVKARSNLGEFTVDSGVFDIPEDVTGMSLNVEHQREDVVGGFTKAWEQEDGIYSTFKYANTPEGRQAFEDGKSGKRKNLSSEVAGVRIQDGKAIAGRLFAAAQVEKPAFAGATLLAAEDTPTEDVVDEAPDHLQVEAPALPEDITVTTPEGESAVYEPQPTPAEETPNEEGQLMANENEAGVAPATVPSTLLAGQAPATAKEVELGTIFNAIADVKNSPNSGDSQTLLAALSDIKMNATGGLTTSASGVIQTDWVGRVWQGRTYERKFINLANHGTRISAGGKKGFKLNQGTALVQAWSGNKAEIPSGTATTSTLASTLRKYGYAADIAREFYDLPGGSEVVEAFLQGVIDSYAEISDADALADIFAAASKTSVDLDRLVAPKTYPTEYSDALGMLLQGVMAVQRAKDAPSFALVNSIAFEQLIYTPKDLVPEFVSFNFATEGTGTADGKVAVVEAPDSAFVGLDETKPQVIVGAKNAIEFDELGSTPIVLDALDIAKGGIDKAVIGYLQTFVARPESLVLLGTVDAA